MAKMRAKSDLPEKPCRHCGRPMTWRKSWARNWDQVLYCSDRCQGEAKAQRRSEAGPAAGAAALKPPRPRSRPPGA